MTPASSPETTRLSTRHSQRLRRWGGRLGFALLAGHLIFCHGCHGDEDNELSAFPPAVREIRKKPESKKVETSNPIFEPGV